MAASLLAIALFVALAVSPSVQVCAPDCTGVDPGTKVRDPTDCTRYYVCVDATGSGVLVPSIDPVECPDGQYFNDQHTSPRCDPINSAPNGFCSQLCNPCEPHCTHAGEVTPDPLDCSTYYVCLQDDHFMSVGCPAETPYFDFMAGECQGDSTLCFHNCDVCEPHCTQQNERVPDPTDCHRFYLCTPPTMSSFLCPHNEIFNRETGVCEEGATCIEECGGGVTDGI
uniref:Obstructor F2 n=1 Tax=Penaeus vannamei TaxID=6689 RepID=A0A6S4IPB2_PENVA|nr:obstructor F2 [Penaeus vannamei]